MSKGAGRVEQAIRAAIARRPGDGRFSSEMVMVAAFGMPPWTAAQQRSALRAMHRIVGGQPGWSIDKQGRRVAFCFKPLPEMPKTKRDAPTYLLQRPAPLRQQALEAAQKRQLRAQAKRPAALFYYWTCGRDTLSAEAAALLRLHLPVGCKVTTIPGSEPAEPRSDDPIARGVLDTVWDGLFACARGRNPLADVLPPPPSLDEVTTNLAVAALARFDELIMEAETNEEVRSNIKAAETVKAMFSHIRTVRQHAEVVILRGQLDLGLQLISQDGVMARAHHDRADLLREFARAILRRAEGAATPPATPP